MPEEGASLKIANLLVEILGLIFVALGLALGVGYGDALGAMVGLVVGIATFVMGMYIFTDVK